MRHRRLAEGKSPLKLRPTSPARELAENYRPPVRMTLGEMYRGMRFVDFPVVPEELDKSPYTKPLDPEEIEFWNQHIDSVNRSAAQLLEEAAA